MVEELKGAGEFALGALHAARDGGQLAKLAGEEHENAIRLAEVTLAEDDGVGAIHAGAVHGDPDGRRGEEAKRRGGGTASFSVSGQSFFFYKGGFTRLFVSFDDGDAGAGAEAAGTGVDQGDGLAQSADAAGRFDADVAAEQVAEVAHVLDGDAAGAGAGAGLNEICAHALRDLADAGLLFGGSKAHFDDNFDDDIFAIAGKAGELGHADDFFDIFLNGAEFAGLEETEIDHDVKLGGAVIEAVARLVDFDLGGSSTQGISDHRADFDIGIAEPAFGHRNPRREHEDAGEVILLGLLASSE